MNGIVRLDENYVRTADGMILKYTKAHHMWRVSIDPPTVTLLQKHRKEPAARLPRLRRSVLERLR